MWARTMKVRTVLMVAFLVAMALPAQAQEPDEPGRVALEDDSGDVEAVVAGTSVGDPAGQYDHLDIVAAEMVEDQQTFTGSIQVARLPDPETGDQEGPVLRLGFHFGDMEYRIQFAGCVFCYPGGNYYAYLNARPDDADNWTTVASASTFDGDLTVDYETSTLAWTFDRDLIQDQNGAPPFPGRTLDRFWAESLHWLGSGGIYVFNQELDAPFQVADEAPDDADFADAVLEIVHGIQQTGHARLRSDVPYRASNGEATTFLYEVTAVNIGDEQDIFTLQATDMPAAWDVTLPIQDLVLGAGKQTTLPVLVSVPFAHKHGDVDTMVLEMHSTSDAQSIGRMELGIRYVDPPQPAGHHDTVHFHSNVQEAAPTDPCAHVCYFSDEAYMNTLQEDPLDTGNPVPARNYGTNVNETGAHSRFQWELPLSPALRLGLDFDIDETGTLTFPVETTAPFQEAFLRGALIRYGPTEVQDGQTDQFFFFQETTILAEFRSDPTDMGPNSDHTFEATLVPTPESDYIPYDPANQLSLVVRLEGTSAPGTVRSAQPVMLPGGSMTLPLLEYHDPVDDLFGDLTGPVMTVLDRAQRIQNPGDLALFHVELRDAGDGAGTYRLSTAGIHPEWASFPAGKTVELPEDGTVTVPVQVRIPDDAFDGETADLFVQAVHADDETLRALARMVVDVDTDTDHPDDSDVHVDTVRDTPGVSVVAALALLGAALATRRRE